MHQSDIIPGKVYVGVCGKRFRRFTDPQIANGAWCYHVEQAIKPSRGNLYRQPMAYYTRISTKAAARWAAREATDEETAAFERVVGQP